MSIFETDESNYGSTSSRLVDQRDEVSEPKTVMEKKPVDTEKTQGCWDAFKASVKEWPHSKTFWIIFGCLLGVIVVAVVLIVVAVTTGSGSSTSDKCTIDIEDDDELGRIDCVPDGVLDEDTLPDEADEIETLDIGKFEGTITTDALNKMTKLEAFEVDDDNERYSAPNGVLYDKEQKEIIKMPMQYDEKKYEVLKTVQKIDEEAFYDCEDLEKLTLNPGIIEIGANAFVGCPKMTIVLNGIDVKFKFTVDGIEFDPSTQYINQSLFKGRDSVKIVVEPNLTYSSDGSPASVYSDSLQICEEHDACGQRLNIVIAVDTGRIKDTYKLKLISGNETVNIDGLWDVYYDIDSGITEPPETADTFQTIVIDDYGTGLSSLSVCYSNDQTRKADDCGQYNELTVSGSNDYYEWTVDTVDNNNNKVIHTYTLTPIVNGILCLKMADNADNSLNPCIKIDDWSCTANEEKEEEEVIVKNYVRSLSAASFVPCPKATRIILPDKLVHLESNTFDQLRQLSEIVINDNTVFNTKEGVLFQGNVLTRYPIDRNGSTYAIDEDIIEIGTHAFFGCQNLEEVILTQNIITIDDTAFSNSSIKKFSVKNISELEVILSTPAGRESTNNKLEISMGDFNKDSDSLELTASYSTPLINLDEKTAKNFYLLLSDNNGNWSETTSFTVMKVEGVTNKTYKVEYRNGTGVEIDLLDQVTETVVVFTSIFPSETAEIGDMIKLYDSLDNYTLVVSQNVNGVSKTVQDLSKIFTYPNTEQKDTIIFKKPGEFTFKLQDADGVSQYPITVTGVRLTRADLSTNKDEVYVVPKNVYAIDKDAFNGLTSLKAIVKSKYSGALPEICDFGTYADGDGNIRYKHIPIFAVNYESPVGCMTPQNETNFKSGTSIPILEFFPNTTSDISEDVNGTFEVYFSEIPEMYVGLYEIHCDCGDIILVELNTWEEDTRNYGIPDNAENYSVDLNIPYGVYSIGTQQYYNIDAIRNIHIPQTVKVIHEKAFGYSTVLDLKLPDGLREIGEYAFYYYKSETAYIPGSVDTFGIGTFNSAQGLTKVVFGEGLSATGDQMFRGSYSLTDVEFNDELVTISGSTFNSTNLEKVVIPDSVKTIGDYAFYWIENLKEVIFGSGVREVASDAFTNCTNLTTVILNEGLEELPIRAFDNVGLKSITFPSTMKIIGGSAFIACEYLEDIALNEGLVKIGSKAFAQTKIKSLFIPSTVTVIEDMPFYEVTTIQSISSKSPEFISTGKELYSNTLKELLVFACAADGVEDYHVSEDIKIIGTYALSKCTTVKSITMPESVTDIQEHAFYKCTNLATVNFSPNIISIGKYAFNMSGVDNIVLPDKLAMVSSHAFSECNNLHTITFGENLVSLSDSVFISSSSLATVNFNDNLTNIGASSFHGCTSLKNVILKDGLQTIGDHAFHQSGIESIIIPDSVTTLDTYAFDECEELTEVVLGGGITELMDYTFSDDTKLTKITFAGGLTKIHKHAFTNTGLTSITLPSSLKSIDTYAFSDSSHLEEVVMNEGLEEIGDYAFWDNRISTVEIPSTVTSIGINPFLSCPLVSITSKAENYVTNENELYEKTEGRLIAVFCYSPNVENYVMSSDILIVGDHVLPKCENIKSIIMGANVTSVGYEAFAVNPYLTSITLNDRLSTIGEKSFSQTGIKSITLPSAVSALSRHSFAECNDLENIIVTSEEEEINFGNMSFFKDVYITSFVLNEGPKSLTGTYVFYNTQLNTITVPYSFYTEGSVSSTFFGYSKINQLCLTGDDENCQTIKGTTFDGWGPELTILCGNMDENQTIVCS